MPGAAYLRSLNPQLPLPVWLLQGGGVANSFGNGLALPFLVIYLHNVRGFSLGTSGLVVAVSSAGQLAAGIFAGPLIDRFGARRTLAVGLVLQAVGNGLGGLAAGSIARIDDPTTFTVLFVLDALTFLAYVGVLAFVHDPGVAPHEQGEAPASYGAVLRHKTFLGLWTLNFLFVAAGYSLFNLLPAFARDHSHLSERQIGAIFFVNTALIVLAQL